MRSRSYLGSRLLALIMVLSGMGALLTGLAIIYWPLALIVCGSALILVGAVLVPFGPDEPVLLTQDQLNELDESTWGRP